MTADEMLAFRRLQRERDRYREGWLLRGRMINGVGEYAEAGRLMTAAEWEMAAPGSKTGPDPAP